jgi:hypothetical protein
MATLKKLRFLFQDIRRMVLLGEATLALQEYPSNLYDVVIIADSFKRDNRCTKYFTNKSN